MPIYVYEAKNLEGVIAKGKIEAQSKDDAKRSLRRRAYYTIAIEEESNLSNLSLNKNKKVTNKDFSLFCRQFHFTLKAGIPMLKSINIVRLQLENKKLSTIMENVYSDVQKGKTLSESLEKYKEIPYMLISMIKVGEATGDLSGIMKNMSQYYDKQHKQQKQIDTAMAYPKFVFSFAILIVLGLVTFVVPSFAQGILSTGGELPTITKIVIGTSYFLEHNFILILGIVGIIYLFKRTILDKNKKILFAKDKFIVKSKYIGIITIQILTARFSRTFGMLVNGGMPILESLEISANVVGNRYIKYKLMECSNDINSGSSIGEALELGNVFPLMLTQMIIVGEEAGSLDEILKQTSEYYESEADFAIKKITSLIEPVMIISLAILVGFVVVALVIPMFQVIGTVG